MALRPPITRSLPFRLYFFNWRAGSYHKNKKPEHFADPLRSHVRVTKGHIKRFPVSMASILKMSGSIITFTCSSESLYVL